MKLLHDLIRALDIKLPVNLMINTRTNKTCDGFYLPDHSDRTGKLKGHRITIYVGNPSRDFETLLAHELIHAWQEENNKYETHGKHFKRIAKKLESEFNLTNIYLKGIDEK